GRQENWPDHIPDDRRGLVPALGSGTRNPAAQASRLVRRIIGRASARPPTSSLQTEAPASARAGILTQAQEHLTIRRAVVSDADTIVHFIRELADYEKLLHEVKITAADIA